jgi:hypothetical protein
MREKAAYCNSRKAFFQFCPETQKPVQNLPRTSKGYQRRAGSNICGIL